MRFRALFLVAIIAIASVITSCGGGYGTSSTNSTQNSTVQVTMSDAPGDAVVSFSVNVDSIVLTGDIHTNWANELVADFDNPHSAVVATEFVGTSISSSGDGRREREDQSTMLSENPFVKFHNQQRGYVTCEVTPKQWRSDFRATPRRPCNSSRTRPASPAPMRASARTSRSPARWPATGKAPASSRARISPPTRSSQR